MDLGKPRSNAPCASTIIATTILSYLESVPIAVLDREVLAGHDFDDIVELPGTFEEFASKVAEDSELWERRFGSLAEKLFSVGWTNAPPIVRLLRDHRYWRWFEFRQLLLVNPETVSGRLHVEEWFSPLLFSYGFASQAGGGVTVVGPVPRVLEGTSLGNARAAFQRFQDCIARTWRLGQPSQRRDDTANLYPIDRLLNAASGRLVRAIEPSTSRVAEITSMLDEVLGLVSVREGEVDVAQIAELSSLVSAKNALASYGMQSPSHSELEQAIELTLLRPTEQLSRRSDLDTILHSGSGEISRLVEHRQDTGALTWTQYFHESMSIMDNWLATSTYFSIAPGAFSLNEGTKLVDWNLLCRFLSDVLLASEVTIYRYSLTEDDAPLAALGAHCAGPNSTGKIDLKRSFMREAARDETLRRRSASYRSASQNATVYVADALANDQATILVPDNTVHEWGRSVLAIPIRIDGNVWGILELVSTMPRHFGTLLRPKCEEAAEILSSTFLSVNIFEAVSKFDTYWADNFGARSGRRPELCRIIADVFLADHVTVFTATRHPSEGSFDVNRFGSWSSPRLAAGERPGVSSVQVREFLDARAKLQELPGPSKSDSRRRTFMVELPPRPASGDWVGALIFSVPHPIVMDASWDKRTIALANLVSSIFADLTSDASWEIEVRNVLRHEYNRVEKNLRGIRTRLEQRIVRTLPDEDKRVAELIMTDLGTVIRSLDTTTEILKATSADRRFFDDPRLIAVKRAKESFDPSKARPIRAREAFYNQFNTAGNAAVGGTLPFTTTGVDFDVVMDETTLSDIIGTLADNATKYSVPRSEVVMNAVTTLSKGLSLTVSNLGPELAPADVEKIFEDGYRGEFARRQLPDKGAGRGLGFAKSAMEIWGGSLGYRSSELGTDGSINPIAGYRIVWHRFILTFPSSIVREHPRKEQP